MLNSKNKPTLILGASEKHDRISFQVANKLIDGGEDVFLIGRGNEVNGVKIHKELLDIEGLDTISLYLNAQRQKEYYEYIIDQNPKRVIFNPGAENAELMELLIENGIHSENACTLVLLTIGAY
jgi:predicted CoA-binding protein